MGRPLGAHTRQDVDALRGEVARACRELAASGLVIGSAGNVSARIGDLVAVTPTGARLSSMTGDRVAVVDIDGSLVDGPLAPTSELPFHLAIYRRYDAGAVVHTHPPMGTAVACVADELPCIHYTLPTLGGTVRVACYATFGSDELATCIVDALEGRRAALIAQHGAVTIGDDLQAALEATELLEWACGVYVHACACGTPRVLGEDEQRALAEAFAEYDAMRSRPAG